MYVIRADGNAKTGAGHLMRCLTIAEALAEETGGREDILFLCADELSAALVQEKGFRVQVLGTDYRCMEQEIPVWEKLWAEEGKKDKDKAEIEIKRETEIKRGTKTEVETKTEKETKIKTETEIKIEIETKVEAKTEIETEQDIKTTCVILIDSYFVTYHYLEMLRRFGITVLMDDMQEDDFPVDAVINYNVYAQECMQELYRNKNTRCYAGGRYVPLRSQFTDCSYQVKERVKNVLITTGGGDVDNIAGAILKELMAEEKNRKNVEKLNYHLIIGRFNPHLEDLQQMAKRNDNLILHHDVQDMAGLMQECDLAITAGGTTIYELSAVGVPFVCFSYAENQEQLTRYIGEKQIAGYAGAWHKNRQGTLLAIRKLFEEFCSEKEKRNECYLKEKKLVDGQGARRLARELIVLGQKTSKK